MQTPIPSLAFAINSVEFVNHYRGVWQHLAPGSFEVIAGGVEERPEDIRAHVLAQGFPCRTMDEVVAGGTRYRSLVTHHPFISSHAETIVPLADQHIRFLYGLGKSGWNFSNWNRMYDAILCFGPHQKEELAKVTDSLLIEMGYPRFDTFFQGVFDRQELLRRYLCEPSRKTLVWLPTWSDLASVARYRDALLALTAACNVVVKLHPFMRHKNPQETAELKALPFNAVIDEPIDNVALYVMADWIIADYGGPMFGAIYTDRKLLLLDLPDIDQHELLGDSSLDVMMRLVIPSIKEPDPILIWQALEDQQLWSDQEIVRAELRSQLFAPYYGCSAQVAAAVIGNIDPILRMQGRRR
jgi:hypothetical protein